MPPNYNPTATVDADSGLIAAADVISGIDEQSHLHEAIDQVREDFMGGDTQRPIEVLADGLMATGENIAACEDKNVDFYTPAGPENPAYREDPSEPVAAEKIADLPLRGKRPKKGEKDTRTFDKSAFITTPTQTFTTVRWEKRLSARVVEKIILVRNVFCIGPIRKPAMAVRYEHSVSRILATSTVVGSSAAFTKRPSKVTLVACKVKHHATSTPGVRR